MEVSRILGGFLAEASVTATQSRLPTGGGPAKPQVRSVTIPRHTGAASTHQEIQIGAAIGLQDMFVIQFVVAPLENSPWRFPSSTPPRHLGLGHIQMQSPRRDIQLNHVSWLYKREGTARGSFRRYMEHRRAIGGAAHHRIGDAH